MKDLCSIYPEIKYQELSGRYVVPDDFERLLDLPGVEVIGQSVKGEPIKMVTLGSGKSRILAWSQMHGNEGTTTKAIADFLNACRLGYCEKLLRGITLKIIPILNPDGARAYTRENSVGVDLNRDFVALSQPETRALSRVFGDFMPHYCFNMHDQRSIFGAGAEGKPAAISFLAPAFDSQRSINLAREKAMEVIAVMNDAIQESIPGMVGRFDDAFNANCAGDAFTLKGASTILFEAGHYPGDYQREKSRELIYSAMAAAVAYIGENDVKGNRTADYLLIPQNKICFYDFVYKNVKINYESNEIITNFAVQYKEIPKSGSIEFLAQIVEVGNLEGFFGHTEFDANGDVFSGFEPGPPKIGAPAHFLIGTRKFVNGMPAE